jgi:hypothetical protein
VYICKCLVFMCSLCVWLSYIYTVLHDIVLRSSLGAQNSGRYSIDLVWFKLLIICSLMYCTLHK